MFVSGYMRRGEFIGPKAQRSFLTLAKTKVHSPSLQRQRLVLPALTGSPYLNRVFPEKLLKRGPYRLADKSHLYPNPLLFKQPSSYDQLADRAAVDIRCDLDDFDWTTVSSRPR